MAFDTRPERNKVDLAQQRRDEAARQRWLSHACWNLAMHSDSHQKELIDDAMRRVTPGRFR